MLKFLLPGYVCVRLVQKFKGGLCCVGLKCGENKEAHLACGEGAVKDSDEGVLSKA